HLLLPEVGEKGQQKLLDSRMLLLGAGGLGSPAALYLAAAGVGTLGLIDMDVVDESNLQRQILHNLDRIGERKVDSAKKTLTALNPDVDVVTYDVRLGADNVNDVLDLGDPLIGRLLAYDALEETFRTFKVNRDPACPACGENAGELVIAEYDELCMPHPRQSPTPA